MRGRLKFISSAVFSLLLALQGGVAHAECKIERQGQLNVALKNNLMTVDVVINGHPAKLILNTAAETTLISKKALAGLGLREHPSVSLEWHGVRGNTVATVADISDLKLGNSTWKNVSILTFSGGDGADGIVGDLGRDLLSKSDVDFDLKKGVISFLKFSGCSDSEMVYWGGSSYSEAPFEARNGMMAPFITTMSLNNRPFRALLDTGAARTAVSSGAAQMAGVKVGDVFQDKATTPATLLKWPDKSFARFDTVAVGEESIRNAYIQVISANLYQSGQFTGTRLGDSSSLLETIGMDFFYSHHVLISNERSMMLFTYSGGSVFPPPPSDDAQKLAKGAAGPPPGSR